MYCFAANLCCANLSCAENRVTLTHSEPENIQKADSAIWHHEGQELTLRTEGEVFNTESYFKYDPIQSLFILGIEVKNPEVTGPIMIKITTDCHTRFLLTYKAALEDNWNPPITERALPERSCTESCEIFLPKQ